MMEKILHIVGDSKFGGGSVIIAQLAVHQKSIGYDVSVLTTDNEFSIYLRDLGINVIHFDCIWRSYNLVKDIYGIVKLTSFLRKNRFDFVHTHTTKAGFIGRVASWLSRVTYIIHTVHGFPFSEVSSKIKVSVFSFLERILFRISNKVVFVSNYHLAWAERLGIVSRSGVAISIRNGVDPISPEKNSQSLRNIVFVGRMVKEKGIFDLLNAFNRIKELHTDVSLLYIGDGPDFLELKSLVEGQTQIHLTGFINDVTQFISEEDIFVLPSYREGLSISAIEAQSMGLASVLSDVGGNVEVSNNGLAAQIFRVTDVENLAKVLNHILSDSEFRETLKVNAKQNYLKNYTSQRMLEEYRELYSTLTSS
jgi:glycosyltransferase involved in cell wall biosynthesis